MPLHPNTTILNGKYHILRLIGKGGMARVWLAEEPRIKRRRVAIKKPKRSVPGFSEVELKRRVQNEIDLSEELRLAHAPHIVLLYTVEEYEGTPLLVMPYMAGGSLKDLLAKHPQGLDWQEAVRIATQALRGLSSLHKLDVVHRDVKPSNILFDGDGVAHLSDFGVAQIRGGTRGRTTMLAGPHPGDPAYAAPEQMRNDGGYLTPATDIYALGSVLFEMLTGKKYKGLEPGTRPSQLRSGIPAWLDEVVVKALKETPWDRWQNGEEMLAALKLGWKEAHKKREGEEKARREKDKKRQEQDVEEKAERGARDENIRANINAIRQTEMKRQQRRQGSREDDLNKEFSAWWLVSALALAVMAIGMFFLVRVMEPKPTLPPNTSTPISQPESVWQFVDMQPYSPKGHLEDETTLLGLTPGIFDIAGVPFSLGWTASTQCSAPEFRNAPEMFSIPLDIANPKQVYFLIQAGMGWNQYSGRKIGQIFIQLEDYEDLQIPLILGENIRDWSEDNPNAVTTVTSPQVIGAYEGAIPGGRKGHIDVLEVSLPLGVNKLTGIQIQDTSNQTVGSIDPCLHIPAVTIRHD